MLLDEIDKIGTERRRSPTAALLEVFDPAQHSHFVDNFLAVPYDLSNVLFLCTANDLGLIHPVLKDRLEMSATAHLVEDVLPAVDLRQWVLTAGGRC
jgi:ATP-dependent Lon protease